MTKDEITEFIKDNLKISVEDVRGIHGDTKIIVSLLLCDEEIDHDTVYIYNQ